MPFGANLYRKPGRGGPLSSSRHQLEQETPDVALGGEPQVCFLYLAPVSGSSIIAKFWSCLSEWPQERLRSPIPCNHFHNLSQSVQIPGIDHFCRRVGIA